MRLGNLAAIAGNRKLEPEERLRRAITNHLRGVLEDVKGTNVYFNALRILPYEQKATHVEGQKQYRAEFQRIVADMKQKGYFGSLDEKIVAFFILGASIP